MRRPTPLTGPTPLSGPKPASRRTPKTLSNNGPPLDDDPRPWGSGGIGHHFEWEAARKKAFDAPYDIVMMRVRRAEALGLTYEEYALELIERGIYLSAEKDAARIAEIRRRRPVRY
jgi:hypothetical protein